MRPARMRLELRRPHPDARAPRRARCGGAGRCGSRCGPARRRRRGSRRRPSAPCAAGRRARAGRWRAAWSRSGEAADLRVGGEPRRGRSRPRRSVRSRSGIVPAAAGHERQQRGAGDAAAPPRARRAAGCCGGLSSVAGRHHAPSRLWPQTRTTLPLTPVEAGLASQAIVSATSTGSPPWREAVHAPPGFADRDRHRWRSSAVSMKPGATALIVAPRSASAGASASTMPITPALEVA